MKALAALLLWATGSFAADRTFLLETHAWTPYTPAYLGSGLIGLSSTRLGTDPAPSFMEGVYDHAPGDVPRLALLPAWNAIDVNNGSHWLNRTSTVSGFHQTLDMYGGVLRTEYQWVDSARSIGITVQAFVSRAEPALGVVRLEIVPAFSGPLTVRMPLTAWPQPKRYALEKIEKLEGAAQNQQTIWYPGHLAPQQCRVRDAGNSGLLEMTAKPDGLNTVASESAALLWPAALSDIAVKEEPSLDACALLVSFHATAGHPYIFEKFVAFAAGQGGPQAVRARSRGYTAVFQAHADAWHDLWQEDIQVEGDPELQTVIHSMMFYLLSSATDRQDVSIPPMGLSSPGYYGHVFWDADTFIFPVLMALQPAIARSLVMFRYRTLGAARRNAQQNGRLGAMYPWEAGPDGTEATPRFAYQNALYENHVNADIALEAWQYFLATGDRAWLERFGYPIIHDTADFWTSRVVYNREKDRYEIPGVVSVDESKIGVTDDPFTNAAAKKNLELAEAAARLLGRPVNAKWNDVASKLYLPRKDLVLIDYPLQFALTGQQKRSIVNRALQQSTGRQSGVMMEVEFQSIPAVELGDRWVLGKLLGRSYAPYLRSPFNVVAETPTNNNTNFLTGAGAFLQQFVFGYSGLRFNQQAGLSREVAPLLPPQISRLVLRNLSIRGRRVTVAIPGAK